MRDAVSGGWKLAILFDFHGLIERDRATRHSNGPENWTGTALANRNPRTGHLETASQTEAGNTMSRRLRSSSVPLAAAAGALAAASVTPASAAANSSRCAARAGLPRTTIEGSTADIGFRTGATAVGQVVVDGEREIEIGSIPSVEDDEQAFQNSWGIDDTRGARLPSAVANLPS